MILHVIRAIFVLAVLAISVSYATTSSILQQPEGGGLSPEKKVTLVIVIPVVLAMLLVLLDMGTEHKSLGGISGLFFGVVSGVVLAYVLGLVVELVAAVFIPLQSPQYTQPPAPPVPRAVGYPLPRPGKAPTSASAPAAGPDKPETEHDRLLADIKHLRTENERLTEALVQRVQALKAVESSPLVAMIKLLVGACTIYLCVSFVMQTKDDFRFIIPYVEFSRQTRGTRPLLLDTSVIIDGRIADIADTRILASPMIVPRFVLEELQEIADSSDKLKRNRGRRGLDMLNRLQSNDKIELRISDFRVPSVEELAEVDQKLVALAQHLNGRIVTNDYNLNKVAQLRGVEVININDLANALKPVFLPGEALTVKIIKPGEEVGQGIGYLDDGTMVVVEQGREHIGQEIAILVTSVLQTSAGRMIFGRPEGSSRSGPAGPSRSGPRRT